MKRRRPQSICFKSQWGLNAGLTQDWGKQRLHFLCVLGPRAKAVTSQKPGPDLLAGLGESPGEVRDNYDSPEGMWSLVAGISGSVHLCEHLVKQTSSWVISTTPGHTQQPVSFSAGMPQVKQPTGLEHSSTCQQTGCLKSS